MLNFTVLRYHDKKDPYILVATFLSDAFVRIRFLKPAEHAHAMGRWHLAFAIPLVSSFR